MERCFGSVTHWVWKKFNLPVGVALNSGPYDGFLFYVII